MYKRLYEVGSSLPNTVRLKEVVQRHVTLSGMAKCQSYEGFRYSKSV